MYPYDEETGALNMSAGPGMLSQINNMVSQGNDQARRDALSSGLIGAGAGLLGYDKRMGPAAGLGAALSGFNQAYDTQLVANKPKVTPLAGGAFVLVQYPDGRQEIVKNDEVQKYMADKAKTDAELWKAKEDYKGNVQTRVAGQKLGDKTSLETAGENASSLNQANELRGIAGKLTTTSDTVGADAVTGFKGVNIAPTGTAAGLINALPNTAASAIAPKSVELRQDAERIIQNSLRATLGAQFTEKEGTRFLERAYNPALSPQQNAERLNKMADELELIAKNKDAAAEYMKKNGTLAGFAPPAVTSNSSTPTPPRISIAGRKDGDVWSEGGFEFRMVNGKPQYRKIQ